MQDNRSKDTSGDYSYDMAHDLGEDPRSAETQDQAAPTQVSTETPDDEGGDYSYDLAHDIPPAEQQ